MIFIVYKDGSWNETESDLQASEYASNPDCIVSIRSETSAQHRMHLTAFGVSMLAFAAGYLSCWFLFVR